MTKAEMIEKVSSKINLTKKDTERVVKIVLESIIQVLAQGDKVELRRFGTFRVRSRDSRDGRNPRTGDTVRIPSKKVPYFKASKKLRELMNQETPRPSEVFSSSGEALMGD